MQVVSMARNPIPSGATVGEFAGYDGKPMRYAAWPATRGPSRGTMVIFQGRTEFIEKYFETVSDLRRRGFAVAIQDWRGQGGSYRPIDDPRKGHISSFQEFDRDLRSFMRDVVLPDCPPPYSALGHSMGGHILLRNIARTDTWFDRAVLTAPMVALTPLALRFPRALVSIYAGLSTAVGLGSRYVQGGTPTSGYGGEFDGNVLTCDSERFQRNKQLERSAPNLLLGSPTVGWLAAALNSMAYIADPEFAGRVRVPALIFGAGEDSIVSTPAVEKLAATLKSATYISIPDARHEILQETDDVRARFWATFDAYFDIPQAAVAAA